MNLINWLFCSVGLAHNYSYIDSPDSIPKYIIDTAPLVYLYSEEKYYPGPVDKYLNNVQFSTNSTNYTYPVSMNTLNSYATQIKKDLNDSNTEIYLTAKHQWEQNGRDADWVTGNKEFRPNLLTGEIKDVYTVLVVVEKPEINATDAFWFYFYPFNLGPYVLGHGPFGNHLGDWEHSLVRYNYETKEPVSVWMSAHGGGTGFTYKSLLSHNTLHPNRPTLFSARGTHAQYTSPGRHPHDLPWHMLSDYADLGDLWDPARNFLAYTLRDGVFKPANGSVPNREKEFGDWILFDGRWGNKMLDPRDERQVWSPFEWRVIDGPTGPVTKNLMRTVPCERTKWWNLFKTCHIRSSVGNGEGWDSNVSGCQSLYNKLPSAISPLASFLTHDGWLCFWLDRYLL